MPIFLDRHDMSGLTADDIAEAHRKDLAIQRDYGVNFITYWFDETRGTGFCLIDAPDIETAEKVHAEAHGNLALDVINVDLSAVQAFLGRIADPGPANQPDAHHAIEPAFRSIMFTDLVDSTAMTERLGDARSVEFVRSHDAIVRRSLREEGGREVKHTGDGIMAAFDDAASSVRAAISVQSGFEIFNMGSDVAMSVRIGINAGEPVEDSNDLFGSTVQMAARVCAEANSGEVLVTDVVEKIVNSEFSMSFSGEKILKGFSDPVRMYSVAAA